MNELITILELKGWAPVKYRDLKLWGILQTDTNKVVFVDNRFSQHEIFQRDLVKDYHTEVWNQNYWVCFSEKYLEELYEYIQRI